MDKMRSEENAAYKSNRAEMEKGLDGVKLALKVLTEYYAKEADHASADGAGSGIIGLLEVCESDFSKGLAEMISTEDSAASAYDRESKENEIEKATKDANSQKVMSETEAKKEKKETEVKKLATKIDQQTADSAQLKEEVAELQASVAALQKSQADMDKIRAEEKALYGKSSSELEMGIEGVKKALQVLTEYYAKADKAHGASSGASEGIIGLLEVCESDFSKELAEITSTEEAAASAYESQSKENELELTTKSQDIKYKTKESKSLDKSVTELSGDRSTVQEELDAVLEYYSKIKDECVAKAEPYEEIKARRTAEIAGLKDALEILESETALVQRSVRRMRGVARH